VKSVCNVFCLNDFDRQRITYEPKWTVPLHDLSLDDKIAIEGVKLLLVIFKVVLLHGYNNRVPTFAHTVS